MECKGEKKNEWSNIMNSTEFNPKESWVVEIGVSTSKAGNIVLGFISPYNPDNKNNKVTNRFWNEFIIYVVLGGIKWLY